MAVRSGSRWRRSRGNGDAVDAVANHDRVVADEHVFDEEPHDPLPLQDVEGFGRRPQACQERREGFGETQMRGAVANLFHQRVQPTRRNWHCARGCRYCVNASRRCDTNWIADWTRPKPPIPRGSARKRWSVPPGRAVKTRRRLCRSGRVRHPGLVPVAQFAVPPTTRLLSDVRASSVSVGSRRGAARRMSR